FLREMAEQGVERVRVVRVFSKRVIVRDGFWFGVDDELVGIAASRLAIERIAPLAENFFKLVLWNRSQLIHCLDTECSQCALRDFADSWNLPHRKRRKKPRFLARGYPHKTARLGLIRCN